MKDYKELKTISELVEFGENHPEIAESDEFQFRLFQLTKKAGVKTETILKRAKRDEEDIVKRNKKEYDKANFVVLAHDYSDKMLAAMRQAGILPTSGSLTIVWKDKAMGTEVTPINLDFPLIGEKIAAKLKKSIKVSFSKVRGPNKSASSPAEERAEEATA